MRRLAPAAAASAKGLLVTLAAAALAAPLATLPARAEAPPAWPAPAQVELVRQRLATFPAARVVSAVDWYQPLEAVPGGVAPPLSLRTAADRRLKPAAAEQVLALAREFDSHALLVWHDGALELEHYGEGFDAAARFDTASMHKTVLALLIGAAVADGLIGSLDDALGRYVPGLSPARAGLPLRALLEMASGIQTPPVTQDPASLYWQALLGDDLRTALGLWPQAGAPFERFGYSSANSQYLAWALEGATGQRYAQYLSRRLWAPLGNAEARLWLDRAGGSARGFCCLQANARDWLRVGLLMLDRGRVGSRVLVPAAHVGRMAAPSAANPNFGWHLWRGSPHAPRRTYVPGGTLFVPAAEPFAADDVVYLDGFGGQRVYIVPSRRVVIVRIGPSSPRWDDARLPNLVLRGLD